MSNGTTEAPARAGAEERGAAGVPDKPSADTAVSSKEEDKLKADQKRRLEGTDRETLIKLFREML